MALTDTQVAQLNKMNEASRRAALGTLVHTLESNAVLGVIHGVHTVIAAEASANTVAITTGLSVIAGFIVQIFRAGVNVMSDAAVARKATDDGTLNVADGASTYSVTTGDVINWIAW